MSRGESVRDWWERYEKVAVPAGAGPHQREALRRAYYVGASAMLGNVAEAIGPDRRAAGGDALERWRAECEAFMVRLRDGLA